MAATPRTRYTRCGDIDLAYQVFGEGPRDILMFTGSAIPIDSVDHDPRMARFYRTMATFGRIIRFDARGTGLSGHLTGDAKLGTAEWVEDTLAVLDTVESEKAVIFAPAMTAATAIHLAAHHPERVAGLILINAAARAIWAEDYPFGAPPEILNTLVDVGLRDDAVEQGFDSIAIVATSMVGDNAFRDWFDRAGNLSATPSMARASFMATIQTDVRDLLDVVTAPTLILHRVDSQFIVVQHGRYLADHMPLAKYVELPGADQLFWIGDVGPLLGEIEEFLTGTRGQSDSDHVLTTILFTDIVGSTERAASLGDVRWRDLLDSHDQMVRHEIARYEGREVNTAGDGFVVTFSSASRAVECAESIVERALVMGIEVRAGIHSGEVEMRGADVAGMAVHIGARVSSLADPSEVLVSSTVREIMTGSDRTFTDRGDHKLKGVPGVWTMWAVEPRGTVRTPAPDPVSDEPAVPPTTSGGAHSRLSGS